ncbi:MAG: glycosyltransferase family 4 protein [Verrucomicrobiales bacterium]
MRIALVSQEYPPETAKGGIGTQTYLKAHGLAARGHEVHVASQTAGPTLQHTRDGNVHVTRTPGFYHRLPIWTEAAAWLTYSTEVAAVIAQLHSENSFDLIDFPEWGAEGYVHLLNRVEDNRIPSVIHLHGPLVMFAHAMAWPEIDSEFYRIGTGMEKTCLRLADAVFSSSQCSIEWCRNYYDLPHEDVPVIHTGVDTALFAPRPLAKEARPTVIFVGRITPNKGVLTLLEACRKLLPEIPHLQLRVIGNGDPGIVHRLMENSPPGLLDLPGYLSSEELPDQLSRAHVFAVPSIYEGGPGFVFLEAMACGLPAIGCEGSGVSEVISSGENGVLVPPGDAEALAVALRELLTNETRREAIGRRAREYVVAHHDREQGLDRIEAFYQSVVQHRR